MHVKISDKPIPEGYKLIDCNNRYTRDEFVERAVPSNIYVPKAKKEEMVKRVNDFLDERSKDIYTDEDWSDWVYFSSGGKPPIGDRSVRRSKRVSNNPSPWWDNAIGYLEDWD